MPVLVFRGLLVLRNEERVVRVVSCVVGAVLEGGGGMEDENPVMEKRVMRFVLEDLEMTRSPWNATLRRT